MKKTLAELAAFFLCLAICTSQSISKDDFFSFAKQLSADGTISTVTIGSPKTWSVWSRTNGKLKKSISSDDTIGLVYKAADDYSMTLSNEFKVTANTVYIISAEFKVSKGDVGPSFVVRNTNGEVMDWGSGYHSVQQQSDTETEWQHGVAVVIVSGGSQRNLVASYIGPLKNDTVGTLEPRIVGSGESNMQIRNVMLLQFKKKPSLAGTQSLTNSMLSVTVSEADASFKVQDKRTGKTYTQFPGNLHGAIVINSERNEVGGQSNSPMASLPKAVTLTALDISECRTLLITYALSDDTVSVSLADTTSSTNDAANANALDCIHTDVMGSEYNFPGPISVSANEYFVLPINEGISFYGNDPDMLTGDFYANYGHGICMPFFGATDGDSGWMCVLDTSDDAGVRLEQRSASVQTASNDSLSKSIANLASPVWGSQCGSFGYTRKCRYIFLQTGGYVAIAKRYRAIAKENGTLVTFSEKKKQRGEEGARRIEKLRGAVNFWTWTDGTASFCKQVHDSGISRILWSDRASPEDIVTMNKIDGVLTGRYDIYQDVMDPKNFNTVQYVSEDWVTEAFPNDIARTVDGKMVQAWPVESKKDPKKYINCVSLCDMTAPDYARKRLAEDLATHAYGARFFDTTTAANLRECYDNKHPMTHTQSKQTRIELLGVISREHHLVSGSETGADYAVPVCDYFEGMLSLGPYRIADAGRNCDQIVTDVPEQITKYQLGETYRLPLWELVYHDCTVAMWYWGDFNNKMPAVWHKRDLFNALYAVPPMFFTNKNDFTKQQSRFVESYNASKDITYATFDTEMTNHTFLTTDREVQMTEFANGVKVIVNFGKKDFSWKGKVIAPGQILSVGISD